MTFSRSCEYALQAALYLGVRHAAGVTVVSLQEIAESQEIPPTFLSKILQTLVRQKLLTSQKGSKGGFALARNPDAVTLLDIVSAIDGLDMFDRCGIGLRACSDENPCPVHHEYKVIKNKVRQVLTHKTLAELSRDVERGTAIIAFRRAEVVGSE
ncbi:MAG TPA: Rrf2 family transcriptional regulator [Candidatus Kapabacteria bacterium]|nr:Rrf2 family transcriptional regulator [Candidatus Kapabacteria bacterium]